MYNKNSLPVELVEFVRWRVQGWCTDHSCCQAQKQNHYITMNKRSRSSWLLVQSTKNVQIPLSEYQSGSIDISKAKSVFSANQGFSNLFHLHPELVSETDNGLQTVICPNCQKHLSKYNCPPMSISAGVDFGDFTRLLLEPPNLHEQILLSRYWLFFVVIKVSSNRQG